MLDERYDEVDDIVRARRVPSMQLAATPDAGDVRPQRAHRHRRDAGRSARRHPRWPRPVLGFVAQQVRARRPQARPAARHHRRVGDAPTASTTPCHRRTGSRPRWFRTRPPRLDLTSGEIQTIIWATGFRPDYSWLDVEVLDRKGLVRHDGGVVDVAGDVPDRRAVPAPAQVELHRRCPRRRRRPRRRARGLPRPSGVARNVVVTRDQVEVGTSPGVIER